MNGNDSLVLAEPIYLGVYSDTTDLKESITAFFIPLTSRVLIVDGAFSPEDMDLALLTGRPRLIPPHFPLRDDVYQDILATLSDAVDVASGDRHAMLKAELQRFQCLYEPPTEAVWLR